MKNETKQAHSPLPWKVEMGVEIFPEDNSSNWHCIAYTLRNPESRDTVQEDKANAAFIVKATNSHYEMVELLKKLLVVVQCSNPQIETPESRTRHNNAEFDIAQLLKKVGA